VPEDAVLGVRAPLTGYASLKQIILHDFQFILYEVVGGKLRKFYHTATLQQTNFISDYLRVTSMNSSYNQQSELSVIKEAHNLKQQSSESRKIRGEADSIITQRPFYEFEFSHLFLRC